MIGCYGFWSAVIFPVFTKVYHSYILCHKLLVNMCLCIAVPSKTCNRFKLSMAAITRLNKMSVSFHAELKFRPLVSALRWDIHTIIKFVFTSRFKEQVLHFHIRMSFPYKSRFLIRIESGESMHFDWSIKKSCICSCVSLPLLRDLKSQNLYLPD